MSEGRVEFEQADIDEAASQEETERLQAENTHLKNRVIMLRALVNRYQSEEKARKAENSPEEDSGKESPDNDDSTTPDEPHPDGDDANTSE